MRLLIIALVLAVSVTAGISTWQGSASAAVDAPAPIAHAPERQKAVDNNDDTRVEVQLVVLGAVLGLVLGAGIAAYLLRRHLGLGAPPPDATSGEHH